MTGKTNDNITVGNIPKSLKLAGPIIDVILAYLPNIFYLNEYKLKKALINLKEHVKQKAIFN